MLGQESKPFGYDTGFVMRGWIHGDEPSTIVIATWARRGSTLRKELRRLAGEEGIEIEVPGAKGARRHDWREHVEEGVVLDDYERTVLVIAATRRDFVSLTVRTPDHDAVVEPVESVVASFRVNP